VRQSGDQHPRRDRGRHDHPGAVLSSRTGRRPACSPRAHLAFYVLEGELTFEIGREPGTITVSAGGFVAVPPGVAHSFRNDCDRPARWLTIHAPDGGFAALMRGVRDGVEVEWDISGVPADGGLPASEVIVVHD
jgi:Cupin domain